MSYTERFGDIQVLSLDTTGFDALSERNKALCYHLAEAGLHGRAISLQQGSQFNMPILRALMTIVKHEPDFSLRGAHTQVQDYLKTFFAHNGIYHSMSGHRLPLPFDAATLLSLASDMSIHDAAMALHSILFETVIPEQRTVQQSGVDVVNVSGGNFYHNLTTEEVLAYRNRYPKHEDHKTPPYGFNAQLCKDEHGNVVEHRIALNGLYGDYVSNIVFHLKEALNYAEGIQKESIETLIQSYTSGNAQDFDTHCVAWTQDRESDIYYVNGMIESYEDPLGVGCTFESIVAFKNPIQTAKVSKITENIQWLEDHMPFDDRFKKEKATGLSASSVTVISMAGETSPTLPLGINLPNSDWIRKEHGSKSVNLANVGASRSKNASEIRETLYLPHYWEDLIRYQEACNSLHTDLHEIAGHGSGQVLPGVNPDVLGPFYSTIEEARADLVGLYYIGEPKLQEWQVIDENVDLSAFMRAQYISYVTNGAMSQLQRVTLGHDLTQAHFRNRQLISTWLLANCPSSVIEMVQKNGHYYIDIHDINALRHAIGTLLSEVQRIKSEGDYESAKNLVETYGTRVDQNIHRDIIDRFERLNLAKVTCFMTPMIEPFDGSYAVKHETDFLRQQMVLTERYV